MQDLDTRQVVYRDTMDALRIKSDAMFGITSKRILRPLEGDVWVRDATQAYDLNAAERPSHEHISIDANNTLLRMLTRLRPIDYMLSQQSPPQVALRDKIKNKFDEYQGYIKLFSDPSSHGQADRDAAIKGIKKAEESFSTFLVERLHEANLTKGCVTQKDAEALLAHYKVLYSVLDPAMPMITLTYDHATHMLQRETHYPITKKKSFQKKYLDELKTVIPHPLDDEKNAHTVRHEAEQLADACFADLIVADDRMLTSQARKSHLVGVKNAFIVKVETERAFNADGGERMRAVLADDPLSWMDDKNPLWLGRMAVPVYVGKGEKDADKINNHVKANLEQLLMASNTYMPHRGSKIHLTTLNTYTNMDGEKQDVMIDGLRQAMEGTASEVSVIPTNDVGMFYTPRLAQSIQHKGYMQPGQKADRLDLAVNVTLEAQQQKQTLSFVNCAGGADRTGTVIEKAIQQHTAKKMNVNPSVVEAMRARGFNSAEIAHHMVPGTPGMKPCSKANNWFGWGRKTFSDVAAREFYLKTADLNKKNKINHVECFNQPSELARQAYDRDRRALEVQLASIGEEHVGSAMRAAAEKILKQADEPSKFKAKHYTQFSEIYKIVTDVMKHISDDDLNDTKLDAIGVHLQRLDTISHKFSAQKKIMKGVKNFIQIALVTVAIMILLNAPWFGAVFVMAGALLTMSTIKLGVSLKLWAGLAHQISSAFMGDVYDKPEHDVFKATHEFTKRGHVFFEQDREKELPNNEEDKNAPKL